MKPLSQEIQPTAAAAWLAANALAVVRLLRDDYGIEGKVDPLVGELDFNLVVESGAVRRLLKVMRAGCDRGLIELQCALLEHATGRLPDLPLQHVVRTRGGQACTTLVDGDGEVRLVWLLTFLAGRTWSALRPHGSALLRQLGGELGRLDRALLDFRHPGAHRELRWDLRRAGWIAAQLDLLAGGERRAMVQAVAERFAAVWSPRLERMRRSVIHGDANDHNVLVARVDGEHRVVGLIDFGDASHTALVAEVVVAATYAMMGKADPAAALAEVVGGYHAALPLQEDELALVFPLVLTRLAVSVTNAALAQRERPDDAYATIHAGPAWRLLAALHGVDPRRIEAHLRLVCGLDAWPATTSVQQYLASPSCVRAEVLGAALPAHRAHVLDLSFESLLGGDDPEDFDPVACGARIDAALRAAGAACGLGRYGEPRPIYTAPVFGVTGRPGASRRTRHLGVDLFAPAGTAVHAPLEGEVVLVQVFRDRLDYGGTVMLRHATPRGVVFGTLYGHLAPASLGRCRVGQRVAAGAALGAIGAPPDNGDWPPHVHVQLIAGDHKTGGDVPPGVADPDTFAAASALYPDPAILLGLPPTSAWSCEPTASLLARRAACTAANLKLSYAAPLRVVRGRRHCLYDIEGRQYIDAYNNVPHVGHGHPRVVEAASRQMNLLATNTRYLHASLVDYADRLVARLPAPLSVCFLVASGSEANELALRLCRAHTGAKDMLVMEHAYHGHTTGAFDVSPYKFAAPGWPGAPDWVHVSVQPDTFRGRYRAGDPDAGRKYAALVRAQLDDLLARGRRIAGYLSESMPSVGGQIVLPPGFLGEVYSAVRAAGGLCVADDVQTALGRTGTHGFGFEEYGVVPDLLVLGKPLGNGYPLGAVVTTPAIAAAFARGPEFFSTFGGNTVACAVGCAVLDALDDDGLQANARRIGQRLLDGLRAIATRHPLVGDVRGRGFFLGVELVADADLTPATRQASYVQERLRERRVLIGTEGPQANVLKIRPPMTFDAAAADVLLEVLDEVLGEDLAQPE